MRSVHWFLRTRKTELVSGRDERPIYGLEGDAGLIVTVTRPAATKTIEASKLCIEKKGLHNNALYIATYIEMRAQTRAFMYCKAFNFISISLTILLMHILVKTDY